MALVIYNMFVNGSGSSQGDVYTCNLIEFICHISTQGFLEKTWSYLKKKLEIIDNK